MALFKTVIEFTDDNSECEVIISNYSSIGFDEEDQDIFWFGLDPTNHIGEVVNNFKIISAERFWTKKQIEKQVADRKLIAEKMSALANLTSEISRIWNNTDDETIEMLNDSYQFNSNFEETASESLQWSNNFNELIK